MDFFEELFEQRGKVDINLIGWDYDAPPYETERDNLDFLLVYRLGDVFCLTLDYDSSCFEDALHEHLLGISNGLADRTLGKWTVQVETSYQEWRILGSGATIYEALDVVRKYSPPRSDAACP